MSVKAFIDEATEAALGIDAANRQVDLAKEGVEAARAALEASRVAVDTAKQGVAAAKEVFESFAERAEQYGLTRSKFKDVVERMKSVLADIGAIEVTAAAEPTEAAEQKPKTPRKRKGEAAAETAPAEQAAEQAPQVDAEQAIESTADTEAGETTGVEDINATAFTEALGVSIANEEIVIAELTDPVSIAAAEKAAAEGHVEWNDVVAADEPAIEAAPVEAPELTRAEAVQTAVEEQIASVVAIFDVAQHNILRAEREVIVGETTDPEVIAAVAEIAEIESVVEDAGIQIEETAHEAEQEDPEDDELDNSMAEQELLDFVDEIGTSDDDVKKVLSAAVKVVSWHTTNVAKAVLRTHSSPLTLAGVLVVEDSAYAPKDIKDAYNVALSFGGEKLAAAISWFNKSLDLLADAKPVEDFRFTEAAKTPRVRKQEPAEAAPAPKAEETIAEAPAVEIVDAAPETTEALDEIIDATVEAAEASETIEDMQLFTAAEEDEAPELAAVEPEPAPVVEKPASVPPKVTRPSWLAK
ncbi:hypothetical protein [Rhizobium sp. BK176]|uniref:hypothetical protein n=1 Tax=Rhizobium sp. BK176 TaxID=2587071 RepID=UPI0021686DCE|nr:hypothetical protein [Rhizobium sp. BK176]MCS4089658.1 hypothetical protein [Rhizobium sp. BK176]